MKSQKLNEIFSKHKIEVSSDVLTDILNEVTTEINGGITRIVSEKEKTYTDKISKTEELLANIKKEKETIVSEKEDIAKKYNEVAKQYESTSERLTALKVLNKNIDETQLNDFVVLAKNRVSEEKPLDVAIEEVINTYGKQVPKSVGRPAGGSDPKKVTTKDETEAFLSKF